MSSVVNTHGVTPGSIYRIHLQNFVTYNEVELYPGPSLNLIVGPNGTGKSTFVCAIILGLCGKPDIIGRATKVHEYIRSGSDKAMIELELYQGKGKKNVIIKRIMFKKQDISKWFIDNKPVDEGKVRELITKFNIQVDNLCQLLPQDKVQDFSNLNPQQLLKSTLSAVKGKDSVEQLETLINAGKEKQNIQNDLAQITKDLEKLQRENDVLRVEVDAMRKRNEYKEQIQICENKEMWLEYKKILEDVKKQNNYKIDAEKSLSECEKDMEPLMKHLDQVKRNIKDMEREKIAISSAIEKSKEIVKNTMNSIVSKEYVYKQAESTYKEKLDKENNRENELQEEEAKLERHITNKTSLEEKFGSEADLQEKSNAAKGKLEKTNATIDLLEKNKKKVENELHHSIEPQIRAANNRLRVLQDVNKERMNTLERHFKATYEAVLWFRQLCKDNPNLFQHPVHEPMMLVMNFKEPKFADYVEATVSARDLVAFVFESRHDMNTFLRKRREHGLCAVNAVCSRADRPAPPPHTLAQLSSLGFYAYLSDTLSAPAAVERYLCHAYGLHRVPLGSDHTYRHAADVPRDLTCYFTERHKFTVRYSAYSGAASTSTFEVRPARLLANSLDVRRIRDAEAELSKLQKEKDDKNNKLKKIVENLETLKIQEAKISEEKQNIDINITKLRNCSALIRVQQQKVQDAKNEPALNVAREKAECKRQQIETALIQCNLHQKLQNTLRELHKSMVKREIISIKLIKCRANLNEHQTEVRNAEAELEKHRAFLENAKTQLRKFSSEAEEKKANLKRLCGNKLPNEQGFPYTAQFQSLPSALSKLREKREELETRMSKISPGDAQAIKEYEQKEKEIEKLKSQENRIKTNNVQLQTSLNEMKEQWLVDVRELIQNINLNFSQMFAKVNCVGEVKLDMGKTEDDFSKYGIGIWVKFRTKEQMMQLTRNTQSGGERALTTALYLLALQRLAAVPFRCVDEINQGMDSVNERIMLQLLVKETTLFQNSQYFLLSPKLLYNLEYNEHVTVHTIMNCKEMMNYKEWDYENFLDKARLLRSK